MWIYEEGNFSKALTPLRAIISRSLADRVCPRGTKTHQFSNGFSRCPLGRTHDLLGLWLAQLLVQIVAEDFDPLPPYAARMLLMKPSISLRSAFESCTSTFTELSTSPAAVPVSPAAWLTVVM
jgi:hypothetical protein